MSELTNIRDSRAAIRRTFLTSASATALLFAAYNFGEAQATENDGDRPPIWIELSGGLDRLDDSQELFAPSVLSDVTAPGQRAVLSDQRPPPYGFEDGAKISYQPDSSDWVFSLAVRYGRASANRHEHQQTPNAHVEVLPFTIGGHSTFGGRSFGGYSFYPGRRQKFADDLSQKSETHTIVDFLAGKDVGLGLFGRGGSSVISGGIRVAQFTSKSNVALEGLPDLQYPSAPITNFPQKYQFNHSKIHFHDFQAVTTDKSSFSGLGPKLDWMASARLGGNDTGNGEITFDWDVNASVLFGRQKVNGSHQTIVNSHYFTYAPQSISVKRPPHVVYKTFAGPCTQAVGHGTQGICARQTNAASSKRSRMITVPSLGGLAALSFKYQNAKVSFGYRADEFFGAIDGGIDARKTFNRGFNGPYAAISIGLGG